MPTEPGKPSLKIPQTCLCFGSKCGAWQWAEAFRGRDGKTYTDGQRLQKEIKPDAYPLQQLGFCGLAGGMTIPALQLKRALEVERASNQEPASTDEPETGAPKGASIQ
jgi:hypothetical protein